MCGGRPDAEGAARATPWTELGAELSGRGAVEQHGGWPMYSKFFDNQGALPHHLHQMTEHAALVGQRSASPRPTTSRRRSTTTAATSPTPSSAWSRAPRRTRCAHCLEIWDQGDNHITDLSRAYRLEPGTGWDVPAGVLHAPGSLCTYEPQWASDVFAMFQSLVDEVPIDWELLVKNVPADRRHDLDYMVWMIDWETNTRPDLQGPLLPPAAPVRPVEEMEDERLRREVDLLRQRRSSRQGADRPARAAR